MCKSKGAFLVGWPLGGAQALQKRQSDPQDSKCVAPFFAAPFTADAKTQLHGTAMDGQSLS